MKMVGKRGFRRLGLGCLYLVGIIGILASGTPATPTLSFDIKTFRFSWTDVPHATHYRLLENPDGYSGYTQVGADIPRGTGTFDHVVPLFERVNASYILQSCFRQICTESSAIYVTGTLVAAIGYFKASNTDPRDLFVEAASADPAAR